MKEAYEYKDEAETLRNENARLRKEIGRLQVMIADETHKNAQLRQIVLGNEEEILELKKKLDELAENYKQNHHDEIALKDEELSCVVTDFNTFKSKTKDIIRKCLNKMAFNECKYSLTYDEAEAFYKEIFND